MKFYAVRKGRQTGVFSSWPECEAQVKGFSGAEYKSFGDREDALRYLRGTEPVLPQTSAENPVAYCDGSASDGRAGFGCLVEGQEYCGRVPMAEQTNQAAELYALFAALLIGWQRKLSGLTVYTDSEYAINCTGDWYENWERNGWRTTNGQPVKHQELIRNIVAVKRNLGARICWLRGHSGNPGNERADRLANVGRGM